MQISRCVVAIVVVALCACVLPVSAQPTIHLTADPYGTECTIVEQPGLVNVYVYVTDVIDVCAIQFGAPVPECWSGAVWVGDVFDEIGVPLPLGTTQDANGIAVYLGNKTSEPGGSGEGLNEFVAGYMVLLAQGIGSTCCEYPVLKADDDYLEWPGPIGASCDETPQYVDVYAESAVVNATPDCPCMAPVSTEDTTWGKMKALYR